MLYATQSCKLSNAFVRYDENHKNHRLETTRSHFCHMLMGRRRSIREKVKKTIAEDRGKNLGERLLGFRVVQKNKKGKKLEMDSKMKTEMVSI